MTADYNDHAENWGGGAPNILILNIHNYEQCQCDQLAGTSGRSVGVLAVPPPLTSLHTTGSLCVPEGEMKHDIRAESGAAGSQRSYLGFLLLCEVIFDVEGLPDLLGGLSFDHVGHRLTGDV